MHIERSIINLGTMGDATINSIEQLGSTETIPHKDEIAQALRRLIDVVAVDGQLSPEQRDEIFGYVGRLTKAIAAPEADVQEEKTTLRALAGLARELPALLPTAQFVLEVVDKVRGWLFP